MAGRDQVGGITMSQPSPGPRERPGRQLPVCDQLAGRGIGSPDLREAKASVVDYVRLGLCC